MSDTFHPVIPESCEKTVAVKPAIITPDNVPTVAHSVFSPAPPIRYIVTSVVTAQIKTAVQNGEFPR